MQVLPKLPHASSVINLPQARATHVGKTSVQARDGHPDYNKRPPCSSMTKAGMGGGWGKKPDRTMQCTKHGVNSKQLLRIGLVSFSLIHFIYSYTGELPLFFSALSSQLSPFLSLNLLCSPKKQIYITAVSSCAIKQFHEPRRKPANVPGANLCNTFYWYESP